MSRVTTLSPQQTNTPMAAAMVLLAALATSTPAIYTPLQAAPKTIDQLAGRWSGWGSVKMSNGATEQVKCVSTFFVENAGKAVRQNLRCASSSYKIDVRANLNVSGTSISGTWEERNHSNSGSVSGTLSGTTFRLAISGPVLNAAMTMASSPCKLNINIAPRNFNVERIAIGLSKC